MSYEIKVVSLQRRSDRRTYMTELFDKIKDPLVYPEDR